MNRLSRRLAIAMDRAPEKLPKPSKDKKEEMLRKKLPSDLDGFLDISPREFCFLRNLFETHPQMSYQTFRSLVKGKINL